MQRGSRFAGAGGGPAGGGGGSQRRTLPLALLIVTVLAAGVLVLSVAALKNSSPATVPGLRGIQRGGSQKQPVADPLTHPAPSPPTKAHGPKTPKGPRQPPPTTQAAANSDTEKSPAASRGEDAPTTQSPTGGVGDFKTEPVTRAGDLADGGFYLFQDADSGQYLSRALDTNVVDSFPREKVFRLHKSGEYKGWAIKGHTRLHLAVESTNKLTVDRPWARTHEQFTFVDAKKKDASSSSEAKHTILIRSRKNNMYLSHATSTEGALVADESKASVAIKWKVLRVTSCDTEEACWGKETMFGAPPGPKDHRVRPDSADEQRSTVDPQRVKWEQKAMQRMAAFGPFPIVGSPKPLSSTSPLKAGDPWDPVLISKRTMKNWASIPGLVEMQFTDDRNTLKIIEELNRNVSASRKTADGKYVACATPLGRIRSDETYEAEPKFNNQPTYRGLFQRGLELFPEARGVMFSNGDILYTPSLTQTIERVLRFLDDKKAAVEAQGKKWHDRWMIVGQRINHEVPADWDLDDARLTAAGDPEAAACDHGFPRWVREIEEHAKQGRIFQSDAEDYFIVSRKMFDWAKIPDFIVGGVAFDNWITSKAARLALKGEAVLIDASKTVTALHQNHGHNIKSSHDTPKSQYNSHLAAHNGGIGGLGHTADAPVATERRSDGSITVYDKHRLMFG